MKCTDCDHWSLLSSCCTAPHRDKKLFSPQECPHFRLRGSKEAVHPCAGCAWHSEAHPCFCPSASATGHADTCPHYRELRLRKPLNWRPRNRYYKSGHPGRGGRR